VAVDRYLFTRFAVYFGRRSCTKLSMPPEAQMTRINKMVRHFVKNDEAATMVEYALMLSLIAVVCIIAVTLIGTNANTIFNNIATNLPA
jgi:pilus assembly protein Flp/PilA